VVAVYFSFYSIALVLILKSNLRSAPTNRQIDDFTVVYNIMKKLKIAQLAPLWIPVPPRIYGGVGLGYN